MGILLLSMGMLALSTSKSVYASCPFCVDLKSKCKKEKESLQMDCDNFQIKGQPAENFLQERPSYFDEQMKFIRYMRNESDLNFECIHMDYHIENRKDANITNPYDENIKYTIKMCMFGNVACLWFTEAYRPPKVDQPISVVAYTKIDYCQSTVQTNNLNSPTETNNSSSPTETNNSNPPAKTSNSNSPDRLAIMMIFVILLTLYNTYH